MKTRFILWISFLTLMALPLCAQNKFTLNLESSSSPNIPSWLQVLTPADSEATALSEFSIQITPQEGMDALAISVIYDEIPGSFLRVYWGPEGQQELLSSNLYEGINMSNRRTLVLSGNYLKTAGRLTFQAGGSYLGIHKIQFKWVSPREILADIEAREASLLANKGDVFYSNETGGAPLVYADDENNREVLRAVLSGTPEKIASGDGFIFTTTFSPRHARIEGEFNGFPLYDDVLVYANSQYVGTLNLHNPDLDDPGFEEDENGILSFVGWRKGSLILPLNSLHQGENTLTFQWSSKGQEPIAARNLILSIKLED